MEMNELKSLLTILAVMFIITCQLFLTEVQINLSSQGTTESYPQMLLSESLYKYTVKQGTIF